MERYARGDEAAFADLYDAIGPRLLAFLRRATRDAPAAEDLMQETLLHMHRARGSFIPPSDDPTSYEPVATSASADDLLHARRLAGRILQRIDALPELQRTAYRLLRDEGLSLKRAAAALGTSVTAVKLRAHRASVALRTVVREMEGLA